MFDRAGTIFCALVCSILMREGARMSNELLAESATVSTGYLL